MAHLDQLIEYLKSLDETMLCELLDISSEEIIERFEDVIEAKRKLLLNEVEIMDSSLEEDEIGTEEYEELDFED